MPKSVATDTPRKPGRPARHTRQNQSDTVGATARISDRKRLVDLWKWVNELHDTHNKSYRWIASHTTRGAGSHGYWQAIHTRIHLDKKPRIRPCVYDWHDIKRLAHVVRDYSATTEKLFTAALEYDKAVAAMNQAAIHLIEVSRSQ